MMCEAQLTINRQIETCLNIFQWSITTNSLFNSYIHFLYANMNKHVRIYIYIIIIHDFWKHKYILVINHIHRHTNSICGKCLTSDPSQSDPTQSKSALLFSGHKIIAPLEHFWFRIIYMQHFLFVRAFLFGAF